MRELWDKWSDCHSDPDQQKRIASAKKSPCTPLFVDQTTGTGNFKGSSGNHTTSLEHCSCIDFNRRRLPCKHMYRLAMELNLFDADFSSDTNAIVEPVRTVKKEALSKTIKKVEKLSDEQQQLMLEILDRINLSTNKNETCIPSSPELEVLITSGLVDRVSNSLVTALAAYQKEELVEICRERGIVLGKILVNDLPDCIVKNCPDLDENKLRYQAIQYSPKIRHGELKEYLTRKYGYCEFYEPDQGFTSYPIIETDLPNDDVTDLLIQYGHYKR